MTEPNMETTDKNSLLSWLRNAAKKFSLDAIDLKELNRDDHFLPNFCEARMVVSVIIIAELLAVVISLIMTVPNLYFSNYFQALLQLSVFIQWIALSCAAGLCLARGYLRKLPNFHALVVAYLLLLLITWAVNEAAIWVLWGLDKVSSPRPLWYAQFHIQNLVISAIINALMLTYFLTKRELTLRTASEAQAKMQALQSRIRPHFVFNTMNIIASLTRSNPEQAENAIEDMSELFRMMLNEDETTVPVKREIEVAEKYLALEALRLENRLEVIWDIGKFPRKAVMPILTLQPLLENAIVQGIEPLANGGAVSIRLWEENERIHIRITNPFAQTRGKKNPEPWLETVENIRQRFNTYYGDTASVDTKKEDGHFHVCVSLPMRAEKS